MIKRILVALDPDSDTPVATKYAIRLAKKFDASLTGLALVDIEHIYSSAGGGGIGTIYYAEMLREHMTKANREEATRLLDEFEKAMEKAGLKHFEIMEEGVPFERIIEDMKYHDLLVVGRESHFFYNKPKQETDTLAKVVKHGVAPTLVVSNIYHEVNRVMVAFDGSAAAARTLQSFVHLLPYGRTPVVELVHVPEGRSEEQIEEANLILRLAESYLRVHEFSDVNKHILKKGDSSSKLLEWARESGPDLILLGAHSVSAIKRIAFGSTTHAMITESEIPLFLSS